MSQFYKPTSKRLERWARADAPDAGADGEKVRSLKEPSASALLDDPRFLAVRVGGPLMVGNSSPPASHPAWPPSLFHLTQALRHLKCRRVPRGDQRQFIVALECASVFGLTIDDPSKCPRKHIAR